jgi:hypothetical protein
MVPICIICIHAISPGRWQPDLLALNLEGKTECNHGGNHTVKL